MIAKTVDPGARFQIVVNGYGYDLLTFVSSAPTKGTVDSQGVVEVQALPGVFVVTIIHNKNGTIIDKVFVTVNNPRLLPKQEIPPVSTTELKIQRYIGDGFSLGSGVNLDTGVVVEGYANGPEIPVGVPLPLAVTIPQGTVFPPGVDLQPGDYVPAGFVIPVGTILPKSSGIPLRDYTFKFGGNHGN